MKEKGKTQHLEMPNKYSDMKPPNQARKKKHNTSAHDMLEKLTYHQDPNQDIHDHVAATTLQNTHTATEPDKHTTNATQLADNKKKDKSHNFEMPSNHTDLLPSNDKKDKNHYMKTHYSETL